MRFFVIWLLVLWALSGCVPGAGAWNNTKPGSPAEVNPEAPVVLLGRYTTPDQPAAVTPAGRGESLLSPPEATQPQAETIATAAPNVALQETPAVTTPVPTADPLMGFQICTPLAGILLEDLPRLISDGYHPPPVYYSDARHPAIDIAFYNWKGHRQIAGTPVQSVLPGRVALVGEDTFPMGNVVIVETRFEQLPASLRAALGMTLDQSLYTLFAHMQDDSLRVQLDQQLAPCTTVGRVGKTGNTQAAHLHLEMRLGPPGTSFVGFQGYIEAATEQERKNYRAWSTSGQFRHFDPLRVLLYEIGVTPTPGGMP